MCSDGVLVGVYDDVFRSVISTCRGVLPTSRAIWVSVLIFSGIRFKSAMRIGRMS